MLKVLKTKENKKFKAFKVSNTAVKNSIFSFHLQVLAVLSYLYIIILLKYRH